MSDVQNTLFVRFLRSGTIVGRLPPGAEVDAAGLERAAAAIRQIDEAIPWGNPHVAGVEIRLDVRAPYRARKAREAEDTSCRPEAEATGGKL